MPKSVNVLSGLAALAIVASFAACSAAPGPTPGPRASEPAPKRASPPADDCLEVVGQPRPQPLARVYDGVARKARCQREVYTIMGGITHFLGVQCSYCHVEPNYEVMTHNKHVANWMARELIPRLEKKTGGEVWCNDCHVVAGKGTAKILKDPRSESWAIEWMTTHLVENFELEGGNPLRCKTCHEGNLKSPGFRKKIILAGEPPPPKAEPATDGKDALPGPAPARTPDAGTALPTGP